MNSKGYVAVTIVMLFLMSSIPLSMAYDDAKEISMSFSYGFTVPSVRENDDGSIHLEIGDLPLSVDGGRYILPVKSLCLLVPSGYTISEISVKTLDDRLLCSDVEVEKAASLCTIDDLEEMKEDDLTIVDSDTYDSRLFEEVGIHRCCGTDIVIVNLYPISYDVLKKEVWYHPEMSLQMDVIGVDESDVILAAEDVWRINALIDNPEMLDTYGTVSAEDAVPYVIITTEELYEAAQEEFDRFIQAKGNALGGAAIVTVESIVGDPEYWVDGMWGDDNPENPFYGGDLIGNESMFNDTQAMIRNFIRDAYTQWHTRYVLLAGDADGVEGGDDLVPVRGLFATEEGLPLSGEKGFEEEDIPSDVYYACLDGSFNLDGDEHFGENRSYNNLTDIDEADLLSELSVGRWCVDSAIEVRNIVEKTLFYESSVDGYLQKCLFVGEYLGFPGISAYGGNYMDELIPIIPDEFMVEMLYERERSWGKVDLLTLLDDATPHLINHLGHGNEDYGLKLRNEDILTLDNDLPFFIYSQTCLAGSFDNYNPWHGHVLEDSAAEHFTVEQAEGAFAVIMNSRYGLGSEDTLLSPSQVVHDSFLRALFEEDILSLGDANHHSKEDHIWHIDENGIRWVFYETNLQGDPAVDIHIPQPIDVDLSLSWTSPKKGSLCVFGTPIVELPFMDDALVFGPIALSVDASSDPDGYLFCVEFYCDDELLDVVYERPFSCGLSGKLFGRHELKAVARSTIGNVEEVSLQIWSLMLQ